MKNLISSLFILLISVSVFGQWTSGTILEKLSRHDAEFIDADNILIAGGQVWNNTSGNSNLSSNAYTYNVNTHTWGIQAMNYTRLEPITVRGDSGVYVIGGVSNWNQQPWVLTPTMELYNNGSFTLSSIPFKTIEGNAVLDPLKEGIIALATFLKYIKAGGTGFPAVKKSTPVVAIIVFPR